MTLYVNNSICFRLQPIASRQSSFPGRMNDLRSALENYPVESSNTGLNNSDLSDTLNFINEVDHDTFGNLNEDVMNQILHSIHTN